MKAKNVLIIFAILAIAVSILSCVGAVGPTDPDRTPKPKSVRIDYSRVQPVPYPDGRDVVGMNWRYDPYQGGVIAMTKTGDDAFSISGISIMTETRVEIWIVDIRMWNGNSAEVCKSIKIDGQEFEVSSTYGHAFFIYGNDGKIRKP